MVVSKLQVVEEAGKEVLVSEVPEPAQSLHAVDTALHHRNQLVGHCLRACVSLSCVHRVGVGLSHLRKVKGLGVPQRTFA